MPIFKRRDTRSAVVAATMDADPGDGGRVLKAAGNTQRWQLEAWDLFGKLSVISQPVEYQSNALRRFDFKIGVIDPAISPTEPVEPLGRKNTRLVRAAQEILAKIGGPDGPIAGLCAVYAANRTVAGDCYLVGMDSAGETEWEILSVREIQPSPTRPGMWQRVYPETGNPVEDFNPTHVKRFYKPRTDAKRLAEAPMRTLIGDCQTLLTLERSLQSRFLNRLSQAGAMKIPNTAQIVGAEVAAGDSTGIANAFMRKVISGTRAQNGNPGLSAAHPIGIVAPRDDLMAVDFLTMDRGIDRVEMELRSEYRHNIAVGMDLPPEAQEGVGGLTRVSTWSISDDTYASYLLPKAKDFTTDFCQAVFWAMLQEWVDFTGENFTPDDIMAIRIVPDGRHVINRPNEAEDYRNLHDRGTISDAALRTHSGSSEAEIPDEDEQVRWVGRQSHVPQLALWGLGVYDKIPWDEINQAKAGPGTPGAGGTPVTKRPVDTSTRPKPADARKAAAELLASTASGYLAAANKTVGAQIRSRAQAYPGMAKALDDVANVDLLAHADLEEIGLSGNDIVAWYAKALHPMTEVLTGTFPLALVEAFIGRLAYIAASERQPLSVASIQRQAFGVIGALPT